MTTSWGSNITVSIYENLKWYEPQPNHESWIKMHSIPPYGQVPHKLAEEEDQYFIPLFQVKEKEPTLKNQGEPWTEGIYKGNLSFRTKIGSVFIFNKFISELSFLVYNVGPFTVLDDEKKFPYLYKFLTFPNLGYWGWEGAKEIKEDFDTYWLLSHAESDAFIAQYAQWHDIFKKLVESKDSALRLECHELGRQNCTK